MYCMASRASHSIMHITTGEADRRTHYIVYMYRVWMNHVNHLMTHKGHADG